MDPSDRSRFAGHHTRQHSPAYKRLHDEHEVRRRNRTAKLRTEDLEYLEHCSFQPNVISTVAMSESGSPKRKTGSSSTVSTPVEESTAINEDVDDSLLAEFDIEDSMRMPWESATPKKKKSMNSVTSPIPASPTRADAKSRSISVRALKSKTPAHYASGVQDHTARIRKARQAKEARERKWH